MCQIKQQLLKSILNRWSHQERDVLRSILNVPTDMNAAIYGVTAQSLSASIGLHESTVRRRLNELKRIGAVFQNQYGSEATRWWPLGGLHAISKVLEEKSAQAA